MNRGRAFLLLSATLLLAGVIVQLVPKQQKLADSSLARGIALAAILPTHLGGAVGRDQPIAETEEMMRAVDEALNFDDAIFRTYELADARVAVYAAWWRPGKMSPRLVAGHTPDVCWPANGWVRDAACEAEFAALGGQLTAAGFLPGECRVFSGAGRPEHVVFWHKVGDEVKSYGNAWAPPWWAIFDEMRRDGLDLRQEQLFVRLSSNRPIEELLARPEIGPLIESLRSLGLGIANGA